MSFSRWIGLPVIALLLQACAGGGSSVPTIAGIQDNSARQGAAAGNQRGSSKRQAVDTGNLQLNFELTRDQVIKGYRDLVEILPTKEGFGRELQRLADLELEAGIDKQLSDDPRVVKSGEEYAKVAIRRYQHYLKTHPDRPDNDLVLYQLARAYALESPIDESTNELSRLVRQFPQSSYSDEVQFRRGENLFVDGDFAAAEEAYGDVVKNHPRSLYFEKSLY